MPILRKISVHHLLATCEFECCPCKNFQALVVSSPSYSSAALAEVGLVTVFDAASLEPIASVEGEQEFGRFGFAVSLGADGQLLVGCPRCGSAEAEVRRESSLKAQLSCEKPPLMS